MTGGHFTSFQIGVYPIVNIYWGWFIIGLTTFIVVIQCFFFVVNHGFGPVDNGQFLVDVPVNMVHTCLCTH